MPSNFAKFMMALSCLLLMAVSVKADTADIENLVFTGTATCFLASCAGFGSGPLTGTYSLDVDTQTIVGPWSFSTPFGTIASTDTGASAPISSVPGTSDIGPAFQEVTTSPNFFEFVFLLFPSTNLQEIGPLATDIHSDACYNLPGPALACTAGYVVTGSTTFAPEPSSLFLLCTGLFGMLGAVRRKLIS